MKGRVFGIKKSLLLKITAIFLFLCFAVATFFAFYSLKIPDLWFYNFCISLGLFQIVKGFFFKLDSALYIGFLLLFIGLAGYLFWFTETRNYAPFFISLAFILASIFTFIFTGQNFHLIFAYSLIFVTIFALLLIKNFITLPIFIAFISLFLVLLVVEIFYNKKWRK